MTKIKLCVHADMNKCVHEYIKLLFMVKYQVLNVMEMENHHLAIIVVDILGENQGIPRLTSGIK